MTGEEIARELINTLSVEYSVPCQELLAAMHDRASANTVAMRTLKVVYPSVIDVGCFSHTLDLVGEKFCTPHLSEFITWWVSLFSHSPKACLLWREQTSRPTVSYSPTRWWSRWEVIKQLMETFGDVEPFLTRNEDLAPATRKKLLTYFNDAQKKSYLQIEIAVIVDAGMPFVQATYQLEGDGPLALTAYEAISALSTAVSLAHYPNVQAVARTICSNVLSQQHWLQYAASCVQPGLQYFEDHKATTMKNLLACYKAACLFSPAKLQEMQPSCADVDSLPAFPFLSGSLDALKSELPAYLAASEDIDASYDPLEFWKRHRSSLPGWAAALLKVLLVQPSSAAAERVFSILKQSFGDQQYRSLQDYIETSLMLQYNNRQ